MASSPYWLQFPSCCSFVQCCLHGHLAKALDSTQSSTGGSCLRGYCCCQSLGVLILALVLGCIQLAEVSSWEYKDLPLGTGPLESGFRGMDVLFLLTLLHHKVTAGA